MGSGCIWCQLYDFLFLLSWSFDTDKDCFLLDGTIDKAGLKKFWKEKIHEINVGGMNSLLYCFLIAAVCVLLGYPSDNVELLYQILG